MKSTFLATLLLPLMFFATACAGLPSQSVQVVETELEFEPYNTIDLTNVFDSDISGYNLQIDDIRKGMFGTVIEMSTNENIELNSSMFIARGLPPAMISASETAMYKYAENAGLTLIAKMLPYPRLDVYERPKLANGEPDMTWFAPQEGEYWFTHRDRIIQVGRLRTTSAGELYLGCHYVEMIERNGLVLEIDELCYRITST